MVAWNPTPKLQCTCWKLLSFMLVESLLLVIIFWRTYHQIRWNSRLRRIVLHIVLLLSCLLRFVFSVGMCNLTMLPIGAACMWWSNSIVLVCTAAVIVQWSNAVTIARGTTQGPTRITVVYPLVFLHSVHLIWTTVMSIHIMVYGLGNPHKIQFYLSDAKTFLLVLRIVNMTTLAFDTVTACYVAVQLRKRVLSAVMSDDMKKRSVIQMAVLMVFLTASLTIQIIMDMPVFFKGLHDSWVSLSFEWFCIIKYCVPGFFLSLAFLYIMRRVEKREPTRVVAPPSVSLVEFVECSSSDCTWCVHHQRYHLNRNKRDLNPMMTISPRTADSSYHSARANLLQELCSSSSTPEYGVNHHRHHRLQQAHQTHIDYQAHGQLQFSSQPHGGYEPFREVPGRRGARCV